MNVDPNSLRDAMTTTASVIALLKQLVDAWPKSNKADITRAKKQLEQAERQFKIAESSAAKGLGYELCPCTWPTQIMTSPDGGEHWECPHCGRESLSKELQLIEALQNQ